MLAVIQRLGIYPRVCVLELTLRCNFRCLHCGSHAGQPRKGELDADQWLDVADQLIEAGCERVTLGGGEPTLLQRWPEIARRLADGGVRVNMITNGWLWNEQLCHVAREAGVENISFSVDGLEQTHDFIRRKSGSYARVLAALDACAETGLQTGVVSHVNQRNLDELEQMRETFASHGVALWQLQLGTPAGEMTSHQDLVIVPKDLLTIIPRLAALRAQPPNPRIMVSDNVGYYGRYERQLREQDRFGVWLGCRAGLQVIGVESDGGLKGCLSLPSGRHDQKHDFVEGNLQQQRLTELWTREGAFSPMRGFEQKKSLTGFCARCPYGDICRGGCFWMSYACSDLPRENPYCFFRVAVENRAYEMLDPQDLETLRQKAPELLS